MTVPRGSSPPRAPLAFRVGILGHRPKRLRDATCDLGVLSSTLSGILTGVKRAVDTFRQENASLFDDGPTRLRAVSPLAEGSDRLFARAALDLGYELCCPMPFAKDAYVEDFSAENTELLSGDSVAEFDALLDDARTTTALTVFELDGDPDDREPAYEQGGQVVINQSDILVVVWDGEQRGKKGGTESTLDGARQKRVPVIRIDPRKPGEWRFDEKSEQPSSLVDLVTHLLELPRQDDSNADALRRFYGERWPSFRVGWVWGTFARLGYHAQAKGAGPEETRQQDAKLPRPDHWSVLRPYSDWTDELAMQFAASYRGAFLIIYGLAVIAVALAVAPVAMNWLNPQGHDREMLAAFLEVLAIVAILFLWVQGRRRQWHERWLDYRLGDELFRHLDLSAPLASERPYPPPSAHLAMYGEPGATWPGWYVRAIERHIGLPNAAMTQAQLSQRACDLDLHLVDQIAYHTRTFHRSHNIERRLDRLGLVFLSLTLAAAALHVAAPYASWLPHLPAGVLIFVGAVFPAIGASLAGINNQGEFKRIAKRSEAMRTNLVQLRSELTALVTDGASPRVLHRAPLADLTTRATKLMVNEVLDWRVVFLDRPLNPPA